MTKLDAIAIPQVVFYGIPIPKGTLQVNSLHNYFVKCNVLHKPFNESLMQITTFWNLKSSARKKAVYLF